MQEHEDFKNLNDIGIDFVSICLNVKFSSYLYSVSNFFFFILF